MLSMEESGAWREADGAELQRKNRRRIGMAAAALVLAAGSHIGAWMVSDAIMGPRHYEAGERQGRHNGVREGFEEAVQSEIAVAVGRLGCGMMQFAREENKQLFPDFEYINCVDKTIAAIPQPGSNR